MRGNPPGNLTHKHSPRYSGLANSKAIHIKHKKEGGLEVVTKKAKGDAIHNKPAAQAVAVELKTHGRKAQAKVENIAKTYRPDLAKIAKARAAVEVKAANITPNPIPKAKPLRGQEALKAKTTKATSA